MMYRVYECERGKKAELMKILEADPYEEESFARIGYKVKDGDMVGQDKEKVYVYISASEELLEKADEKLKDVAKPAEEDVQKKIEEKIREEEETVASGVSMFGE